jgi:K+-transporting ATPase ATPase B chain
MPIEADRMTTAALARPLFDPPLVRQAVKDSFLKLAPWVQWRNPVMFVVFVGSVLITGLWIIQLGGGLAQEGRPGFVLAVALWLWATLLARRRRPHCVRVGGTWWRAAFRAAEPTSPMHRLLPARYGAAMSCWSRLATPSRAMAR